MGTIRSLVTTWLDSDLTEDYCTNTVYHTIGGSVFDPGVDYQNHANEIRDAFFGIAGGSSNFPDYVGRNGRVVVYDLGDPQPRPERAVATYTPTVPDADVDYGAHQVALVLSFFGTRNLPSQRGHIYIGPYKLAQVLGPRPNATQQGNLINLGNALFNIGGEDVAHVIRSRKLESDTVVQNYYAKNTWDTQRRRMLAPTARQTLHP